MLLETVRLSDLTIDDAGSFRGVGLYHDLRQVLINDAFLFRRPPLNAAANYDRVLFLNLTFWSAAEPSDVLVDDHIPADVVAHVAWHHLARRALDGGAPSAEAMFLGESIASAFDLYLVGRLLENAPTSEFIETQVPLMAERALATGVSSESFERLLKDVAAEPERAFEDLRALLYDAMCSLLLAQSVDDAAARLAAFDGHRFSSLLHHFELSNWILFARAHARGDSSDARVREIDAAMRGTKDSVAWLDAHWVQPALADPARRGG